MANNAVYFRVKTGDTLFNFAKQALQYTMPAALRIPYMHAKLSSDMKSKYPAIKANDYISVNVFLFKEKPNTNFEKHPHQNLITKLKVEKGKGYMDLARRLLKMKGYINQQNPVDQRVLNILTGRISAEFDRTLFPGESVGLGPVCTPDGLPEKVGYFTKDEYEEFSKRLRHPTKNHSESSPTTDSAYLPSLEKICLDLCIDVYEIKRTGCPYKKSEYEKSRLNAKQLYYMPTEKYDDSRSGFKGQKYTKNDKSPINNLSRYPKTIIAFAGTEFEYGDFITDFLSGLQQSTAQYDRARDIALDNKGEAGLYYTGHSLGGGLACCASANHVGAKAITFNAAGVADNYVSPKLNPKLNRDTENTNYCMNMDILSNGQEVLGRFPLKGFAIATVYGVNKVLDKDTHQKEKQILQNMIRVLQPLIMGIQARANTLEWGLDILGKGAESVLDFFLSDSAMQELKKMGSLIPAVEIIPVYIYNWIQGLSSDDISEQKLVEHITEGKEEISQANETWDFETYLLMAREMIIVLLKKESTLSLGNIALACLLLAERMLTTLEFTRSIVSEPVRVFKMSTTAHKSSTIENYIHGRIEQQELGEK